MGERRFALTGFIGYRDRFINKIIIIHPNQVSFLASIIRQIIAKTSFSYNIDTLESQRSCC